MTKAREWLRRSRLPHTLPDQVRVYWISGHSGIPGNELADQVTRVAMDVSPPPLTLLTFSSAKMWINNTKISA